MDKVCYILIFIFSIQFGWFIAEGIEHRLSSHKIAVAQAPPVKYQEMLVDPRWQKSKCVVYIGQDQISHTIKCENSKGETLLNNF